MYHELREELEQILQSDILSKELNTAPRILNFQIEEPIDRQFGLLATNIAFIFSKKLKEQEGRIISPQLIAESISKFIPQSKFESSVDGGGFININPTREFIKDYFAFEPRALNLEIDVSWNSETLMEQIQRSDEAQYLIRELSMRGESLSLSDSLQLLSILGDEEINSRPYLNGYGGRENTPSYIQKFKEVIALLPGPDGELELSELNSFTEKLLLFLGRVDESASRKHPERIMGLILKLMRDFFSQYNHPTTRRLILNQPNIPFLFHAKSCKIQILSVLCALKFSCQLPITVL